MSDTTKREFTELALDGKNYLTWAFDVEIHLASYELSETIVPNSTNSSAQKAKALIFLRHHLNENLKNEYLTENDPLILWQSLKDRFDQQKNISFPQAPYDWLNLRFQDFKCITEYNSALHRIVSQLRLGKQNVTNIDMIEKTLSTFHVSNLVLQQQYRTKNYATQSELISALLMAKKHNQLLMKNDNARPVGSQAMPEAQFVTQRNNNKCGRGRDGRNSSWSHRGARGGNSNWSYHRGRGQGYNKFNRTQSRGSSSGKDKNNINPSQQRNAPTQHNRDQKQICHRCGCEGHWSRTCRTPRHLVEAYHRMQKERKGKEIQGGTHHASLPEANMTFNEDKDDLLNVELEDFGDNE